MDYTKKPHTSIFIGQTGCGKTHLVLELIENQYNKHFDYNWIENVDKVWLIEPKDKLYQWIEKLSQLLASFKTLFIIDDIIADERLDKRRQPLLELTISGRYRYHYLGLLTQSGHAKIFKKTGQGHFCMVPEGTRRSQGDTRGK